MSKLEETASCSDTFFASVCTAMTDRCLANRLLQLPENSPELAIAEAEAQRRSAAEARQKGSDLKLVVSR
jgi:hypothetical protein